METKVSTVTPRQTVTPNKDIIGEDREDVNRLNKGEANSCYTVCVCGGELIMTRVYPVITTVHPYVWEVFISTFCSSTKALMHVDRVEIKCKNVVVHTERPPSSLHRLYRPEE